MFNLWFIKPLPQDWYVFRGTLPVLGIESCDAHSVAEVTARDGQKGRMLVFLLRVI